MKKKNISRFIFLILIIILIVLIIYALTNKEEARTISMYNKISNESKYTFSMEEQNLDYEYTFTISKLNNNINIDVKTGEEDYTSTLTKDGYAYYIIHANKEYYKYESSDIDSDILKNGLSELEDKNYNQGTEEIQGITYYYEEYEDIYTFVMMPNYSENESSVKTRFYFDEEDIKYIKNIFDEGEELLKVELKSDVDETVFEIPEDYAEI